MSLDPVLCADGCGRPADRERQMSRDPWLRGVAPDQIVKWTGRPQFACDADITVYWPDVRPVWEDREPMSDGHTELVCEPHATQEGE